MKQIIRAWILVLALALTFGLVPQTVYAHDDTANAETSEGTQATINDLRQQRKNAAKERSEQAKQARQAAGEEVKERFRRACENRRSNYQNRLTSVVERAERHMGAIDNIVSRVKTFKEQNNLTVENYDQLLESIEAKKQVLGDLQHAAEDQAAVEFTCERDDALEQVRALNDILHQQISLLKEYKGAVRDLIVAVKTAAEAKESGNED